MAFGWGIVSTGKHLDIKSGRRSPRPAEASSSASIAATRAVRTSSRRSTEHAPRTVSWATSSRTRAGVTLGAPPRVSDSISSRGRRNATG